MTGEAATGSSVVAHDDARDDRLAYLGAGPLLAVVLGFALVPLRETVGASNLGFAFVVLTVVISAFGGRAAQSQPNVRIDNEDQIAIDPTAIPWQQRPQTVVVSPIH